MNFSSENANKIYNSYFKRVEKVLHGMDKNGREDLTMELKSHIFESMASSVHADEITTLLSALEKLGEPEIYLKPVAAERKLRQATKTFKPKYIASAIISNIGNGLFNTIRSVTFGILYIVGFSFLLTIFAKIVSPNKTGLFVGESGTVSFGIISNTEGSKEILGYWIIPICIATVAILYLIITLLLRLTIKRRKKNVL
jgi:uncharacterized membrane protein